MSAEAVLTDERGSPDPPEGMGEPPRPRAPLVVRVARVVAGAGITALGVVLVVWWATGGTWVIISTPSMGTYAPVGTLLWVQPVDLAAVEVGEVITFRARVGTSPERTYTHRVVTREADGTLRTQGDLNGTPDPWRVRQEDVVGRVAARWPAAIGWLVRALPLLIVGGIVWWLLTAVLIPRRTRAPLRLLGAAVLITIALNVYDPLFGATQLGFVPLGPAGARATYVGTGLLPLTMEAEGATPVVVRAGHKESIVVPHPDGDGRFVVHLEPVIPWFVWLVVGAVCAVPAVWSVIVGAEAAPRRTRRKREATAAEPQPLPS